MQPSRRKLALRLLLAALLLVGQFGAQVHAYAHATNPAPVDPSSLHTQACNLCSSFAPLLSAVGSSACAFVVDAGGEVRAQRAHGPLALLQRPVLAFRSRAPPVLF